MLILLAVLCTTASSALTQGPTAATTSRDPPDRELTAEAYIELRRPTAVSVAPDGDAVVLAVQAADLASNRFFATLYLWRETAGGEWIAPRFGTLRDPSWSRGGTRIGFLAADPLDAPEALRDSARADPAGFVQFWSVDAEGPGTPRRLTDFGGGVIDYTWAPDGTALVLAREEPGATPALWRVSVAADSAERIWPGDDGAREVALSPDGRTLVYTTNDSGAEEDYLNYDLELLDLETGRSRRLTHRPGPEANPTWMDDGSAVILRAPTDPSLPTGQTALFRVTLDGRIQNLTDAFDRSVLDHRPVGDRVVFATAIGTRTHLFTLRADGAVQSLAGGETSYGAFDVSGSGVTFAVRQSGSEPPELWRLGGVGPDRVTRLNPGAWDWSLGRQEVISWRAPDGLSVEGLLVYPAAYEEGRRYPLLVHPAGGPGGRALDVLAQSAAYQLFAAAGYLVLAPNFRGGTGYGRDFAALPRRGLAGGHMADVMAGIRHVADLGLADLDRVGIYGSGSATRFTERALTRTPLFDAAVLQFGIDGLVWSGERGVRAPGGWRQARRERREEARTIQAALLIVAAAPGADGIGEGSREARSLYELLEGLQKDAEMVELAGAEDLSPRERVDLFFRQLRWMDRHLKLGGADLFSFYMVGETVPGPEGWVLQVDQVETVRAYSAVQPDSGRFVEVALEFQPEASRGRGRRVPGFQLDPAEGVRLVGPDGERRPLAGTVTELFGERTLVLGMPAAFSVPESHRGAPTALILHLAFQVPYEAGAYRLLVDGFRPIRMWLPPQEVDAGSSP